MQGLFSKKEALLTISEKKGLARSRNRRELHEIFIKRGEIKKGFSPDVPARYLTLRTGVNSELQPSHGMIGLSFETEEYVRVGNPGIFVFTFHVDTLTHPPSWKQTQTHIINTCFAQYFSSPHTKAQRQPSSPAGHTRYDAEMSGQRKDAARNRLRSFTRTRRQSPVPEDEAACVTAPAHVRAGGCVAAGSGAVRATGVADEAKAGAAPAAAALADGGAGGAAKAGGGANCIGIETCIGAGRPLGASCGCGCGICCHGTKHCDASEPAGAASGRP